MKMILKDGKRRVLTLSYDDGVKQDRRLMEILDKYGIKCTFNIGTGLYDYGMRMSKEETVGLFKNSGHEVAAHGFSHPYLETLNSTDIMQEIIKDRENIEKDFGTVCRGLAYPFGTYSDTVIKTLKQCGIVYARTIRSTNSFDFPENWLKLDPTTRHKDPNLMELAKKFVEDDQTAGWKSRMFYLWGHSYEFDFDDNWNVIEEFAKYMGGRDNIWYATNIEVYDYVTAYNRMEKSFDNKIIHNPSAIDVWVEIDSKIYAVKGGETLYL